MKAGFLSSEPLRAILDETKSFKKGWRKQNGKHGTGLTGIWSGHGWVCSICLQRTEHEAGHKYNGKSGSDRNLVWWFPAVAAVAWVFRGNSISEADPCSYKNTEEDGFSKNQMLWLAAATGMDALAEGVTFAMVGGSGFPAAIVTITMVTVGMSAIGVMAGNLAGYWLKMKTNLAGGVILIILGVKILLEHLGILNF